MGGLCFQVLGSLGVLGVLGVFVFKTPSPEVAFLSFWDRVVVLIIVTQLKTFRTKCRLLFTSFAINCGLIPSW